MANIFIAHRNQTAEASLQHSFERSVRQLEGLTKRLIAWQPTPKEDDFPKPDLSEFGVPPDTPPENVQAELQSRTVAATAAVLTEAYGEGGQYQAEGYTIQSSPQDGGKTTYQVAERSSRQVVFAFERDDGVLNMLENQLTTEQTQDFLQVAQRITELGFEPLEKDTTGQTQAQILGKLAPNNQLQAKSVERPILKADRAQPHVPVTALDLVQWRYASVVLGRGTHQTAHITAMAQAAAKVQKQSFLQLYQQDRLARLLLQPESPDMSQMHKDIDQLKDLVWQIGPARVEQLYQMQQQLTQPVHIANNAQIQPTASAQQLER